MRSFARIVFSFIVSLHPDEFRIEFGEEMLWIFDEQTRNDSRKAFSTVLYAELLIDALWSAFTQNILREPTQPKATGTLFAQVGSTSRVAEAAQDGFIVFASLFSIFSVVLCIRMVMSGL